MKFNNIKITAVAVLVAFTAFNCSNDDNSPMGPTGPNFTGTYVQKDQMARPAVNTVFTSSGSKDAFNSTPPSQQDAAFKTMFKNNLEALSPAFNDPTDTNALGLTSDAFAGVLATDVLTVSLDGVTTFYDGVPANTLTGRRLDDNVIKVELLLIFGGEDFSENPQLSDDHVDANDKAFSTSFPYLAAPF